MSHNYVIFSGSTLNSVPSKFYLKNQEYKNIYAYAKTLNEAKEKFKEATLEECKWAQIVCLKTFNIIESELSFKIDEPLYEGYYSSDDE
jgi:hypothetical protein